MQSRLVEAVQGRQAVFGRLARDAAIGPAPLQRGVDRERERCAGRMRPAANPGPLVETRDVPQVDWPGSGLREIRGGRPEAESAEPTLESLTRVRHHGISRVPGGTRGRCERREGPDDGPGRRRRVDREQGLGAPGGRRVRETEARHIWRKGRPSQKTRRRVFDGGCGPPDRPFERDTLDQAERLQDVERRVELSLGRKAGLRDGDGPGIGDAERMRIRPFALDNGRSRGQPARETGEPALKGQCVGFALGVDEPSRRQTLGLNHQDNPAVDDLGPGPHDAGVRDMRAKDDWGLRSLSATAEERSRPVGPARDDGDPCRLVCDRGGVARADIGHRLRPARLRSQRSRGQHERARATVCGRRREQNQHQRGRQPNDEQKRGSESATRQPLANRRRQKEERREQATSVRACAAMPIDERWQRHEAGQCERPREHLRHASEPPEPSRRTA